jgi:hypothetical protein
VEAQRLEAPVRGEFDSELVLVPWTPGPLIRIEATGRERDQKLGLPIDPSDSDVRALIDAYEALLLLTASRTDVAWRDVPVIVSAHLAVLEAASLLRWAPPAGPAEREYVCRRVRAINALADPGATEQLAYLRQAIGEPPGG